MAEWPDRGQRPDDDRTRVMRSPEPGRPHEPGRGPQPAYPAQSGPADPTQVSPQPAAAGGAFSQASEQRAGSSGQRSGRVYGRERAGSSPMRPLRAGRGGDPPPEDPGGGGTRGRSRSGGGKRRPLRIILMVLATLLVLLLVGSVAGYFWINGRLVAIEGVLDDYEGRPADTPGENWLLVGSDSRKGLTAEQRRKLATGRAAGQRTDTMMLLHIPAGGDRPTLVSLPRDSYVPIPGKGRNKLNAAYAFGSGKLLVRTVEQVTDIRIDNYMEIGFAGFVGIVDAIGGVEINVKQDIRDPKAGINLKKGVQTLDGGTALGYVRTRATGALPDLDRTQRQRQLFGAVVKKAASPGVLLNPFTSLPLASSATDSVLVDGGTGAFDLLGLGLAMGDGPITTSVPVGSTPTLPGVGSVIQWDRAKALRLFQALREDKPVPKDVLLKS
ncbi:LCP family protein [Spongiactinospora sp. TRM90649]|uniref:LCP family protein n=1 Tax=Spongiactinospora sp. TRM90649 TaxID=3031114 RepID=UPI0023F93DEC|nr:LCP family protein [Spongiactinospora sp. TRM90649]MDF5752985.1 LCP family protein [Spongiactinospora sp. TRM90649]